MKKGKILRGVLTFFGLLGFALIFGGVFGAYIAPASYARAVTMVLIGFGILAVVIIGNLIYQRLSKRPRLDKRGRKALGIKL